MSTVARKMRWALANSRAELLCGMLADSCEFLTIAGSIRRKEMLVGDIELVAVPKYKADLLGEPSDSLLDGRLCALQRCKVLSEPLKDGERMKQFTLLSVAGDIDTITVDLFITAPERLGVILALRTGPAGFSKKLVTQVAHGGLLRDGLSVDDGRVWRGRQYGEDGTLLRAGELLETPTERAFFEHTTCGWVDPVKRELLLSHSERRR